MPSINSNEVLTRGRGAIITGGASGIGLATARRLAMLGMRVCIADLDGDALEAAVTELASLTHGGMADVLAVKTDVSSPAEVKQLGAAAFERFGDIAVLMNNAAAFRGGDAFSDLNDWRHLIDVNVLGVVNGVQCIGRTMVDRGKPGAIVNTGSKQGITSPPGNTAYNVSKAAVRSLTEGLAHTLRNLPGCQVTAHLLIPGFTYTGDTARRIPKKPAAAWLPDQVAQRLIEGLQAGEFYILCQDNETTREIDERRILWAANDIIENRPALSRWHPGFKDAFDAFMSKNSPK